ncbi:hypothetical protein KY333_04620 [Candidatus Woesearchaeota archaeon]|nr:hypothetical protein [Candidatus Woesearchaeota archaeon]
MSRGKSKKKKSKGEYFRQGRRSTRTLEHHVPASFLATAQEYGVSLRMLRDKIITYADEDGLHIEHVSHKNKSGSRIRIIETEQVFPTDRVQSIKKDGLLYIDDVTNTEYRFILENSNGQREQDFIATDLSRKTPKNIKHILVAYSRGGLR